ncbi:hypothetical protein RF11_10732 [Thelohanellus kitauei]|uniref:Uncharacterized protein n=1 Tax=Thelohanellus kitauei TaxID=669202 RepID=A0A0C2IJF9_THEKT|nr:hypothetical protein RF11_10732 [Thelohanellus kitauei]
MDPQQNEDDEANERDIRNFLNVKPSDNFTEQMCAVKNWMSRFSHENNISFDLLFINNFPTLLYDEFSRISNGETDVENYQDKKILLFEVFTFIFRNKNAKFDDPKAQSFVRFFLTFIKTHDRASNIPIDDLIDSINVCISNDRYAAMFIEENGMLNFYIYFGLNSTYLKIEFRKMCSNVHKICCIKKSRLNLDKLTFCIDEFQNNLVKTKDNECLHIFLSFLNMIHHIKLLFKLEYDADKIYEITEIPFLTYCHNKAYIMFKPILILLKNY